jgi:hypothetical protein
MEANGSKGMSQLDTLQAANYKSSITYVVTFAS